MSKPDILSLYEFKNPQLRQQALTHASVGEGHNERLEWLGDALLDLALGRLLFERYPQLAEGPLTQVRARLVNGRALAALARKIGLPAQLRMSAGEIRGGGRERDSILAGAVEAYFAAIYLDGGMAAVQKAVAVLWAEALQDADNVVRGGGEALKDYKTRLQEHLQKYGGQPPQYNMLAQGEISRRFYCVVECRLDASHATVAVAGNRRDAEKAAGGCLLAALTA